MSSNGIKSTSIRRKKAVRNEFPTWIFVVVHNCWDYDRDLFRNFIGFTWNARNSVRETSKSDVVDGKKPNACGYFNCSYRLVVLDVNHTFHSSLTPCHEIHGGIIDELVGNSSSFSFRGSHQPIMSCNWWEWINVNRHTMEWCIIIFGSIFVMLINQKASFSHVN